MKEGSREGRKAGREGERKDIKNMNQKVKKDEGEGRLERGERREFNIFLECL